MTKHDAFVALLTAPDPHDLPRRRSVVTQPGHPERHVWWAEQPKVHAALLQVDRENGRAA